MAQLPPKTPSITRNWPNSFPHQRMPFMANFLPATTTSTTANHSHHTPQSPPQQQSSWVDEFLEFSTSRRAAHRRSISNSITFLETPLVEEDIQCRINSNNNNNSNNNSSNVNVFSSSNIHGFERLDDEQLMSMFSDDMTMAVPPTLSSSPSDQNSNNDEKGIKPSDGDEEKHIEPKNEPGEVESSSKSESDSQLAPPLGGCGGGGAISSATDTIINDPKRVKRILANRQSAQRSRVRKLQYISELERSVTSLQTEVSALSPRVAFFDQQRLNLNIHNSALKQRIAALDQDRIFKDAHQEALKKEIERLRQVYHQQSLKKMSNLNPPPPQQPQPPNSTDTN